MESMLEVLVWIVIVMLLFYVCNTICFVRTAASLFISFLITSVFIYLIYQSLFGEIILMLSFTIGMIYAIFRAVRDKRDDFSRTKDSGGTATNADNLGAGAARVSETDPRNRHETRAGKVKSFSSMMGIGF